MEQPGFKYMKMRLGGQLNLEPCCGYRNLPLKYFEIFFWRIFFYSGRNKDLLKAI